MARGLYRSYDRPSDTYIVGVDKLALVGRVRRTQKGFEFVPFTDSLWKLPRLQSRTMAEMMELVGVEYDRAYAAEIHRIVERTRAVERGEKPAPYCPPEIMAAKLAYYEMCERETKRYGG